MIKVPLPPNQPLSAAVCLFPCGYQPHLIYTFPKRPLRIVFVVRSVGTTDKRTPGNPPANTRFRNLTVMGFPLLACARATQHDPGVPALCFVPICTGFYKKNAPIHTYTADIKSSLQNRRYRAIFCGGIRFGAITHVQGALRIVFCVPDVPCTTP